MRIICGPLGGNRKKFSPSRPGPSILTMNKHSSEEGFSEKGDRERKEGRKEGRRDERRIRRG